MLKELEAGWFINGQLHWDHHEYSRLLWNLKMEWGMMAFSDEEDFEKVNFSWIDPGREMTPKRINNYVTRTVTISIVETGEVLISYEMHSRIYTDGSSFISLASRRKCLYIT